MTSYCKARWCRFSSSHTTKGHKCGRCGKYGHGDAECSNNYDIESLIPFHIETLPVELHCTVEDCNYKQYHTIDAHHCPVCKLRTTHTVANCPSTILSMTPTIDTPPPNKTYNIKCPMCREDNYISKLTKLYCITDKCCICMENVVNVLLPNCGHCCICTTCLSTLDKF